MGAEAQDEAWGFDVVVPGEATVEGLKTLTELLWQKRQEVEEKKRELSILQSAADEYESQIKQTLEAAGLERFDGPSCTVFLREKLSVKVPRTPEARAAFFAYLREAGIYEELVTVNSNTLNSWYRNEVEVRRANGQPETVPGLEDVNTYTDLSVRRK